jgi:hypothetical protein
MYFSILPDLDQSRPGSEKIGIAEIPEIGFILKTGVLKELAAVSGINTPSTYPSAPLASVSVLKLSPYKN